MNRTGRLMELMIHLNRQTKSTVQELADHFAVSRRTMLRDLHLLSEMGLPLQAIPGTHGGYTLIRSQQLPPVSLTSEEAISLLMSHEVLEAFPVSPFRDNQLSVLTKLRSVLPPAVLQEVEALQELVAMDVPTRAYEAPFLRELLQAAKDGVHVDIEYKSLSGRSKRTIFPYGLVASQGFWYCVSYCYQRRQRVWFRGDRIVGFERREDFCGDAPRERLQDILRENGEVNRGPLVLRATLTPKGCNMAEWHPDFGQFVTRAGDGSGRIELNFAATHLEKVGYFLLSLGQEVEVESPVEVIAFLAEQAKRILHKTVTKTKEASR